MEWQDDAIVIGIRRLGEADVILEAMTREHGRHLGVVRGGRSRRLQPALQAGNSLIVSWRARIDEQLGHFAIEPTKLRAATYMAHREALYAVTCIASLLRLLPERDPHPDVHDQLTAMLDHLADPAAAAQLVVQFELLMLAELGFGLDLSTCASTGQETELTYVSPKSGRAVSRLAGEPWRDRLLRLPAFLSDEAHPSAEDLADGFDLTGFFLMRHVLEPRGLAFADARDGFVAAVLGRRNSPQRAIGAGRS